MTPSLDQWEKDLFFRVAEEVQESAVNSRTIRVARSVREQESDSHCLLPVMTKRNFKEISVAAASSPMNGGDVSVVKDVSHIPEIKASDVLNAYKRICIDWLEKELESSSTGSTPMGCLDNYFFFPRQQLNLTFTYYMTRHETLKMTEVIMEHGSRYNILNVSLVFAFKFVV
ncbi:hypothetical protein Bca52824_057002 [Brassica carinata]|uniref:Uncharacterized protein n=1 Tax=Brassica carinata TaxID=52824 RepID=A0A8X7QQE6_BRACI|nr:hypothetical protein Bca52824_057002 [Brassica carinata]